MFTTVYMKCAGNVFFQWKTFSLNKASHRGHPPNMEIISVTALQNPKVGSVLILTNGWRLRRISFCDLVPLFPCVLGNWTPSAEIRLLKWLTSEADVLTTCAIRLTQCLVKPFLECGIPPKEGFFFYLIWGHSPKMYSPVPSLCWSNCITKQVNQFSFLAVAGLHFFLPWFSKQSKKSIICTAPCEVFHTRNSASISLSYLSSQFFLLGTRLWPHKPVGCCWNGLNTATIKTNWSTNWILRDFSIQKGKRYSLLITLFANVYTMWL